MAEDFDVLPEKTLGAAVGGGLPQIPIGGFIAGGRVGGNSPRTEEERLNEMRRVLRQRQELQRQLEIRKQQRQQELADQWEARLFEKRSLRKQASSQKLGRPKHAQRQVTAASTATGADQHRRLEPTSRLSFININQASPTAKTAAAESAFDTHLEGQSAEEEETPRAARVAKDQVALMAAAVGSPSANFGRRLRRRAPEQGHAWDGIVQDLTEKMRQEFPFHLLVKGLNDDEYGRMMMKLAKGEENKRAESKRRKQAGEGRTATKNTPSPRDGSGGASIGDGAFDAKAPADASQRLLARRFRFRQTRNVAAQVLACRSRMAGALLDVTAEIPSSTLDGSP